jgi:hypothetical protein
MKLSLTGINTNRINLSFWGLTGCAMSKKNPIGTDKDNAIVEPDQGV